MLPIPKSLMFELQLQCDMTTQRALDAVRKATSAACQRQILNITCQFLKGDLFPFHFQSKCYTSGKCMCPLTIYSCCYKIMKRICLLGESHAEEMMGQYMGCFQDGKARILNGTKGNLGQGNSPSACITYCLQAGFSYAGVEYS